MLTGPDRWEAPEPRNAFSLRRRQTKGDPWSLGVFATGLVLAFSIAWPSDAREGAGGVTGRVVVVGDPSRPLRLPVTKHRSVCGDSKRSEDFLISRDGSLANVVVTIEGAVAAPRPPQAAVLDNRECVFVPHVQVIQAGEVLEIRSSDRVIHTAHAYDERKRTLFNVALPVYRRSVRRTLERPGIYRIVCDVGHTWMSAYIVVVDHPYAAVTDALGGFRITGVPPGAYRLRLWHERLGAREEPVVIRPGSEASMKLTLDAGHGGARLPYLPSSAGVKKAR